MAFAHGKVILLGEHAVVYGVPAIAAGISIGARATARAADRAKLTLGDQEIDAARSADLVGALTSLLGALGAGPHEVVVSSDLPAGAGLGSSAAMGVAAARAVLQALGQPEERERVLDAALAWEKVFHGNPSGIDTAAALFGGCIWFTRAEGASKLALARPLTLAVAVAGPPASTKVMVESVARLRDRRPEVFEKSLEGIRSLVKNARLALEAGDLPGLGRLIDLNQMLLAGLMVSTSEIERACQIARDAGALGAKLTGAGGGGAVVALCAEDASPVLDAWKAAGLTCFSTRVECDAEGAHG